MSETLPKWKPKFKKGECFAMLMFASRNSGKSYLMRHLIRDHLKHQYDIFVMVSDSPDTKKDFEPCLPPGAIFLTDMRYELVDRLVATNKVREAEGKRPFTMLLMMDDKIGNGVKNDQNLLQIFTRGRHIGVSVIFSSQAKKLAESAWLNNADYTIILKQNSAQQKKSILENVLKGTILIEDERTENNVIRAIVAKYASAQGDALVVNNASQSNDNLYWYRAP